MIGEVSSNVIDRIEYCRLLYTSLRSITIELFEKDERYVNILNCMQLYYLVISWSEGNCVTTPTIHFTTLVWPFLKAAIRHET